MKGNYSKLLTNIASVAGLAGMSFLVTLPSQAKEVLNPSPSIFSEAPYNRSQRIQANASYTPVQPAIATDKNNTRTRTVVAQKTPNRGLNPRPSIFDEPPYNRGSRTEAAPVTPPAATPDQPPATEVPATETPAPTSTNETSDSKKTVVALAESSNSFKTLTAALKAAGLIDTLQGAGPFTIFAPTDAAFAKLPQDALNDLLKPENKEVLVKILTYHVVPGKVLSSDLKSGQVTSLQGDPIAVKVDENGVVVNDGKVTQPDIQGSNGVIHAIDNVILPPSL
ncbi:fasciclin domain-containing protein [Nostoc spongiaeforme FACHB-130]|uniref:Fasciclin domain-containing protein n=1 Tax=Nostoc spongiaeforme FACHB-130 TaxID=1357510 RepID=A0ABR8FT55_9NOSO|nr:fasciclin domain-containing protein [Nostoc spongiaeforme]MBD2594426.1 fasciclin domain-containing protein [Nostoc spongiaeforme FACHB-130]